MRFRELDPAVVRQLLEQTDEKGVPLYQDVLTPLVAKEEALFRNSICPSCRGTSLEAFVDPSRPFVPGSLLPNRNLRCLSCNTEFDPYSGIIRRVIHERG